jgi:hypothetical protein
LCVDDFDNAKDLDNITGRAGVHKVLFELHFYGPWYFVVNAARQTFLHRFREVSD